MVKPNLKSGWELSERRVSTLRGTRWHLSLEAIAMMLPLIARDENRVGPRVALYQLTYLWTAWQWRVCRVTLTPVDSYFRVLVPNVTPLAHQWPAVEEWGDVALRQSWHRETLSLSGTLEIYFKADAFSFGVTLALLLLGGHHLLPARNTGCAVNQEGECQGTHLTRKTYSGPSLAHTEPRN
eukprot:4790334-Amphidinium_carterae.2